MAQKLVCIRDGAITAAIFGTGDENARRIEERFAVRLENRSGGADAGDAVTVTGEDPAQVERAARVLEYLSRMITAGDYLEDQTVDYVIETVSADAQGDLEELDGAVIAITSRGKPIKPKTAGQRRYIEAIKKSTVTFGLGPAGTGKTFLAVAMAVEALRSKQVDRIILTRPAVEAGERLGFLPGDLQSKIDPYLRPLYDALFEMLGAENYARQLERGAIEIAPLAYMRGRTLDDSYIILDEAQNTTVEQMKMFLTRLGHNSRMVVTGDPSQTDLPDGKKSGLAVAERILAGIDGIAIHRFTERDVVRHRLVQSIIRAYEKYGRDEHEKPVARSFTVRRTK
ncbi:MAG: PhoH family protein [Clostridia bacterium]|nr:PhoH family protein [Clostridia bacterium]